jgi:AraC-like DNA-binding protein
LDVLEFQYLISDLRRWALRRVDPRGPDRDRLEDIFQQARVLLSVQNTYHDTFRHSDPLKFSALSRMTIALSSSRTSEQIVETLASHLSEFDIPGIMVALADELQPDIGGVTIEYLTPLGINVDDRFPYRLRAGQFLPRSFFPRERPWVMMMEVLYHSGMCIGYALMETGPTHIPLYDSIRTLLSHALYSVYVREGRSRLREILLRTEPVTGILAKETAPHLPEPDQPHSSSGDAANIIEYLVDHIDEMTDLERMAADLSISKSTLVRRTRGATGYSVQSLHEMLKIERAKIMLQNGAYKLADIAASLGYQNSCYFSAVFKKNTGMSPRDWRKSL